MKRLFSAALVIGLAGLVGCEQKSGTAPATNPNKPDETRKLTVTVKEAQTITQDATDEVLVHVNRDNFKEDVTLVVTNLPPGVSLLTDKLVVPADQNTLTITLKAAADARPVDDHIFNITGSARDIKAEPANVKLTVKAK